MRKETYSYSMGYLLNKLRNVVYTLKYSYLNYLEE